MWMHVYRDFSDLSKSEQLALFEAMKQDLFLEERQDIAKMLKDIRETRFSDGLACLDCGSVSVQISCETALFVQGLREIFQRYDEYTISRFKIPS